MSVRAGQYNTPMRLLNEVLTDDGQGGKTRTWKDIGRVIWAKIRPVAANERLEKHRGEHDVTHFISVRHDDAIQADSRLQYDGRNFLIKGIYDVDERRRVQMITAKEETA